MLASNPTTLGALLLFAGSGLFLLTLLSLRFLPRHKIASHADASPATDTDSTHQEAVLLVNDGGKIAYINQQAKEWFNLTEDRPNLEGLARLVRPSESFLDLCAGEHQARLSLNGRYIEGTSYVAPYNGSYAVLVSLRRPQWIVENAPSNLPAQVEVSNQTFGLLTEVNQAISSNLNLEDTLHAVLEGVERLIPSDISEINIWEAENEHLIPYRFVGMSGEDRRLEKSSDRYVLGKGYTGHLAEMRQPLLVSNVDEFSGAQPYVDRAQIPFQSYVGIPLLMAGDLVGTLELASLSPAGFSENDLEMLRILSGQAAVAIHNALLYEAEQKRAKELSGLANLAQAVSVLREHQDLIARLVESLGSLLDVEVLGFLLYDENRRLLKGQIPFQGVQSNAVEWYQTEIDPGSDAEKIIAGLETIVAVNAPEDPRLIALGLNHLAQAGGIFNTVLVPLTSGGRFLGYLQAADKLDESNFDHDDLRLLAIMAGQVAPILENAALVQQASRRAQRAETLRRIASLTGSNATLEEILKYSTQDLARLLQADIAALFLLDEGKGELRLHRSSIFGLSVEIPTWLGRLPTSDRQFANTAAAIQNQIVYEDLSIDEAPAFYKPLLDSQNIRSVVFVPLIVRERSLGEILIGSQKAEFFSRGDILSAGTVASQLAAAIEQATLTSQTDQNLRQRIQQMTALTRISREINSTFDLEHLLNRVFDEIIQLTGAECGTILLFEISGETIREDLITLSVGDTPGKKLHPLERVVLTQGASLIVEDYHQPAELIHPSFLQEKVSLQSPHEGVRSALIVPIAYQGMVAGLIHLHAEAAGHFDESSQEICESLAVQAAIAFSNVHRYQDQVRHGEMLNRRVDTLSRLFETAQVLQSEPSLDGALHAVATGIQHATPFDVVLISVYENDQEALQRRVGVGIPAEAMSELQQHPQSWSAIDQLLKPEFCFGRTYFIPFEQMPIVPADVHTVTLLEQNGSQPEGDQWHPDDLLLLPLMGKDGRPLGLISLDAPRNKLRPDLPTIETLEVFGSQAAIAIENFDRLQKLAAKMHSTDDEFEQNRAAELNAQNQLPDLLDKGIPRDRILHEMDQRTLRIQAGLAIAESVHHQKDRKDVFVALGQEIITRMGIETVLIAETSGESLRLIQVLGEVPEGVNVQALFGQRNPLRQSLQNGELHLASNLDEDSQDWQETPLLHALQAQAFFCVPITIQDQPDSAVLAISQKPMAPFTAEDERLFDLLSEQVAIALKNLHLLDEIKRRLREVNLLMDFSRQLGSLDPTGILHSLVDSALHVVPSAQAAMVAVWDELCESLVLHAASGYDNPDKLFEISFRSGEGLIGRAFAEGITIRQDEVDFARDFNLSSENMLRYRDATEGKPPVSSLLVPIVGSAAAKSEQSLPLGMLVLDNFQVVGAFSSEDQALITSLVQQTALTLENAGLYRASERRARQLESLTDIAAAITSSLKTDELIDLLLDQLQAILPYETGTLWLRKGNKKTDAGLMVVRAARGFEDSEQRVGISVAVEDSQLLNEMIHSGQPISVADMTTDDRFTSLVEHSNLSWLGIPLIASGEVIGVIALEKAEAKFYTHEHVQIATTFAGQAAVALANARLYQESVQRAQELDRRTQTLLMLNRLSEELSGSLNLQHILKYGIQELYKVIQCSTVSAILFDGPGEIMLYAEYPSYNEKLPLALPDAPLFERLRQTLGIFHSEDVQQELELASLQDFFGGRETRSLLALPLATGSDLHGMIFAQSNQPHRFGADEVELARTISNQTAIAVQNARLFTETRSLTEDLEQRVKLRTNELEREHHRTQTLLHIITELSSSLDLDQVLNRTLRVLNEMINAEQISLLIVRPGEKRLHRLASLGYSGDGAAGSNESLTELDQNLGNWVIMQRQALLIEDLSQDHNWNELLASSTPLRRSAIAVPLMVGAESLGSLLLFHRELDHFSKDQLELVQAAGKQIAVAVNNAELYRLIRDQAEDLGSMLRNQQIETSRSRAILEAVADGVLVTDAHKKITLFNASAEKILGMERTQVVGKSLEYFTGLFGKAAQTWRETIQTWSQDPASYEPGGTYAEQINLENGRVVAVRLAPVILRSDFLGTVSIFQDITHQVEVDRLKSEFVATVSHELRTPMTSIKGYVEILLMGAAGALNEQQSHFLDIVKTNTERLAVLVNDLLDISRIEAGRVNLSMQPINLEELIDEALADIRRRSKEDDKPVTLILDFEASLPRVFGDIERIRQVLDNLLDNAYQYNTPDGEILIRLRRNGEEIQVDVKDSGVGIPLMEQDRVFERFFRGEGPLVLGVSGTGLGLSIVQNLIHMHHGRIWLESLGIPGEGSTFSFTLPVYHHNKEENDSSEARTARRRKERAE